MIPLKVTVENFLTYASPAVEFDFDGEPLWILCGPNGTGKSAVFDAITYALFGCFRGSDRKGNRAEELIHHDANWFRVEFEFEFGGADFRVTRKKASKGPPKVAVARRTRRDHDENGWEPLENINGVRELDAWVSDTLGLSFNTFVCSVMLRQGKAEEIIDADRDTRLKVLHGIIDFGRYVNLHRRVTDDATVVTRELKALQARLTGAPAITEQDLAVAKTACEAAETALTRSRDGHRAARERLGYARTWEVLQEQKKAIDTGLCAAAERYARAATITAQAKRLRELREVLPVLSSLLRLGVAITTGRTECEEKTQSLQSAGAHRDAITLAVEQERQKAELQRDIIADLDRRIPETDARVKELGAQLQRAKDVAQLRQEIADLDMIINGFDADLGKQVEAAEGRLKLARAAREALPHLEAIIDNRANYVAAELTANEAVAAEACASTEAAALLERIQKAEKGKDTEENALREAERKRAESATRLTDAEVKLEKFRTVAEGAVCSECGQAIDAKHAASELAKLQALIAKAKQVLAECATAVQTATGKLTAAQQELLTLQQQHRGLEQTKGESKRSKEQALTRRRDAETTFQRNAKKLAESYSLKLAPIGVAGFPTLEDIETTSKASEAVDAVNTEVESLRQRQHALALKTTERNEKQTALTRLGGESPAPGAVEELATLQTELSRMTINRKSEAAACQRATSEEKRLGEDLKKADCKVTQLTGQLATATAGVRAAEQQQTTEHRRLPAEWGSCADGLTDTKVQTWTAERNSLDMSGVESDAVALANDQAVKANLDQQMREVDARISQVPEDSRRVVAIVEAEVRAADDAQNTAEATRTKAVRQFDDLMRRCEERQALQREVADQERKKALQDRLVELLGKAGLQRDLVRDAEREIVDLANETLFRVSNGDLRLERPNSGEDDDEAVFDLSVRQAGIPRPIGLALLSGSQRFRVAVALALAVGRFASRQARPLEAVIIDEGFGCLDSTGRVGMIEELQRLQRAGNLPNPLKRIILVSHHQDFSDAFPVGYELSNVGGITEARMFRK